MNGRLSCSVCFLSVRLGSTQEAWGSEKSEGGTPPALRSWSGARTAGGEEWERERENANTGC